MLRKYLYILSVLFFLLISLELVAYFILRITVPSYPNKDKYNIQFSPYTIFEATPFYTSETQDTAQPLIYSDKYGFISNDSTLYEKDDVIRVFLLGGSFIYGSGQVDGFDKVKPYNKNIYSYNQSIAGVLLGLLQKEFPNRQFQIVNAAFYGKSILQNYLLYIHKIKALNPNLIISLDGKNDILNLVNGGDVYEAAAQIWKDRMIYMYNHNRRFSSNLITLLYLYLIKDYKRIDFSKKKLFGFNNTNKEEYNILKPQFIKNVQNTNRIIDDFQKNVRADSLKMIFGIQPLLARERKQLSSIESSFIKEINLFYNRNTISELPANDYWNTLLRSDTIYKEATYFYKYFFDDYLSANWDSLSAKNGIVYMDFGIESRNLLSDFELYTDDCHLTKAGNIFVAQKLFESIMKNKLIKDNE